MAWTLSMESSGGGGAEESITDAEKEVLLLFFVTRVFERTFVPFYFFDLQ
jgi:hypothetical protein